MKQDCQMDTLDRVFDMGRRQLDYERSVINLIASDNAKSLASSKLRAYEGHMIQEGILDKRPFAGAEIHDEIERLASELACSVYQAEHANLQPHSCSQANQAVYHALLEAGDPAVALQFDAGGHLTHGMKLNFSGQRYDFSFFGMTADQEIDYDALAKLVVKVRPKLIVCGSSACPKLFDAERLRTIADQCGARLMLDLSHEAGLIAGKVIPNPVPLADVVTMSLDKTLRGPHGGAILCKADIASKIDKAVHPGTQSSFPINKLFEAATALIHTRTESFHAYAARTMNNAKTFENVFRKRGLRMISNGTEKHYVIVDTRPLGLTGTEAEKRLENINILTNRQALPGDTTKKMSRSGGVRLGTPWISSRGYLEGDAAKIADIVTDALQLAHEDHPALIRLQDKVNTLTSTRRPTDVWDTSTN